MDMLLRIKSEYNSLSKAEKKVADYLMENPSDFLSHSAIEIGTHSGSSSATVIRFSQQLGFKSLEELKITIAQQLGEMENSDELDKVIQSDDSPEQLARKLSQLVVETVQMSIHQLDYTQLGEALQCIQNAGHVYIYGIGTSGIAANDLFLKLNRANIRATYTSDAHAAIEFSIHMKPTDVGVAFSYSGRTREVIMAATQAKKSGARVIAVTRDTPSPLSRLADILLTVPDNEHLLRIGALASKYSTLMMVDLLFLGAIQTNMDEIRDDIFATAKIIQNLKERENKSGKD